MNRGAGSALSGVDDNLNLYAYVRNDPLNRTDPTGHLAAVGGFVIGGAAVVVYVCVTNPECNRSISNALSPLLQHDDNPLLSPLPPAQAHSEEDGQQGEQPQPGQQADDQQKQHKGARPSPNGTVIGASRRPLTGETNADGEGGRFPEDVQDCAEEQSGGICEYCGKKTDKTADSYKDRPETDHATAYSKGGSGSKCNAVHCCGECNRGPGGKFGKGLLEWLKKKFPDIFK